MFSLTRKRLGWLAIAAMFVACASSPEVRTSKKKKKKKRKTDDVALKAKKDKGDDEDTKPRKKKDSEDEDKPKKDKEEEPKKEKDDEVVVSDEPEEETTKSKKKNGEKEVAAKAKKDKKAKKEEVKEEQAEEDGEEIAAKKKDKKAKKEEDGEEVAAKKKDKKAKKEETEEEVDEESVEAEKPKKETKAAAKKRKEEEAKLAAKQKREEEAAAKKEKEEEAKLAAKQKKEEEAAAKKKKDDKKKKAEEEEEEVAAEEPPEEPEPTKVAAKSKKKDAKKKTAAVDMTGDDSSFIDMESEGKEPERVEDQPPDRRGVAIPVPGVDSEGETPEEQAPVGANPFAINERPLVLPKDKLAVHGGLLVNVLTLQPAGGMKTSTTSEGLALGVNYGVGDSSEVGLDYAAGLNPGTAKGPITLHGAYRAKQSPKVDVAIAAALAIDFTGSTDPVTMQTTSATYISLQLGAWARYRVGRKASIFTGVPATPDSTVSLSKLSFALPPLPYQLAIGVNNKGTIALDLPFGVGYQATPKVYVLGILDLAHFRIANSANAFVFKDFIPLTLGGFYAMNKLDIGVQFSDDLKQGADYLRFETLVRYSIK